MNYIKKSFIDETMREYISYQFVCITGYRINFSPAMERLHNILANIKIQDKYKNI